jgi:hypothetical protein
MEMVHYSFPRIKADKTPFYIMPLGDIQWTGEPGDIATRILEERIDYGLSIGAKFIGMGDYIDYASPSNRQALRGAKIYDNARKVHDNAARFLVDDLYARYLHKTKGHWLGLLEGHHFSELETGITTDQYLAEKLQCPHLGTCAYVGLQFKLGPTNSGTVNIWCHHGAGNGQSTAAPVAKLEKILPDFEADIFLIGHMTKQATAPTNRVYPQWSNDPMFHKLRHITKILVGTGGFGKGYILRNMQGQVPRGTYVEQGMMRPAVLGCPVVKIVPKMMSKTVNGREIAWFQPSISAEVGG